MKNNKSSYFNEWTPVQLEVRKDETQTKVSREAIFG